MIETLESSLVGSKYPRRALSSSWLRKKNVEPLKLLVPDLVWTAVAAPPVMPCAASKLLVETLTFSMVSTGAMYPAWCGSHTLMLAAPSMRVTLLLRFVPLMLVLERAARRVGLRVLEHRRRRAGDQVHQVLIVAVLVQRQVGDILGPEVDADVGLVRLEDGRFRGDRDRLGQRANLEAAVDADDVADDDRDAGLDELLEALQRGLQRISATRDVSNRVGAGLVGDGRQLEAGVLVLDGHGGSGHCGARTVGDRSGQASVERLRGDRGRQQTDGCQGHGDTGFEREQTKTSYRRKPSGLPHSESSLKTDRRANRRVGTTFQGPLIAWRRETAVEPVDLVLTSAIRLPGYRIVKQQKRRSQNCNQLRSK